MKTRRSRKTNRNSAVIAGNLMFAPLVAAMRMPLLATEAQSGKPMHGETLRAVNEKTAAIAEGLVAAQFSYLQSMMQFWPEVMSGRTPSVLNGDAVERSAMAAMRPASRTVKANFRRLAIKK